MRILAVSLPGEGHLNPLVPVLQAAARAGHDVQVATAASYAPDVAAAGLRPVAAGPDFRFDAWPQRWPELSAIAPADQFTWWLRTIAREVAPSLVRDLSELVDRWAPHLLLTEYAAAPTTSIVVERRGIPGVTAAWAVEPGYDAVDSAATGIDDVRAQFQLPPVGGAGLLAAMTAVLSFLPPSWGALDGPPLATTLRVRLAAEPALAAASVPAARQQPFVYGTLGTVYGSVRLLRAMIAGIAQSGCQGLVTVSRRLDPARVGSTEGVAVEQYVPQGDVLQRSDAVICHGGLGTVLGAMDAGLPMVIVPLGSDQLLNADRAQRLGIARILQPEDVTPASVGEALRDVLRDPAYRDRAQVLRDELHQMPTADAAVAALAARLR